VEKALLREERRRQIARQSRGACVRGRGLCRRRSLGIFLARATDRSPSLHDGGAVDDVLKTRFVCGRLRSRSVDKRVVAA
jgi:hypothetical protein